MATDERFLYPSNAWLCLLRACLVPGTAGADAWCQWVNTAGGAHALLSAEWHHTKRWWPLLWTALRRNRMETAPEIRVPLKSACAAESIRHTHCRRVASDVTSLLTEWGFKPVLLKGMALAEIVYEEPFLRHCHGLDVLIRTGDLLTAATRLTAGLHFDPRHTVQSTSCIRLVHRSGLPVLLRREIFENGFSEFATEFVDNDDLPCDILARAYAICQVCREAGQGDDFPYAWISDAWHLLRSFETEDCELLNSLAVQGTGARLLTERLDYIHDIFGTN